MYNNSVFSSDNYKSFYKSITSDGELLDVLTSMPAAYGVVVNDAEALAKKFMETTVSYEYIRDCTLDEDVMAALDDFMETCGERSSLTRLEVLHRMNFGLGLYDDTELLGKRLTMKEMKTRFDKYMKAEGYKECSEENLVESIKEKLSHSCLSSNHLRDYKRKLSKSYDPLATSVVLGEMGYRYRCIHSMDLYLRNGTMSVEEAVYLGSQEADIQAVACAARFGEITNEHAKNLINSITSTGQYFFLIAAIASVILLASEELAAVLILAAIFSLIACVGLCAVEKKVDESTCIGSFVAKHRYASYNREDVLDGLEIIADTIDVESQEVTEAHTESAKAEFQVQTPATVIV